MSTAEPEKGNLGRIALKQVRMTRAQVEERQRQERAAANPMNSLVPYLDLFGRLGDTELARVAGVQPEVVQNLRKQVTDVNRALARYVDLLDRLGDDELVRLTGATAKTVRFWRLSQPRSFDAPGTQDGRDAAQATQLVGKAAAAVDEDSQAREAPRPAASAPQAPPTPSDSVVASLDTGLTGQPFPGFDTEAEVLEETLDEDDAIEIGVFEREENTAKDAVPDEDEFEDLGEL